MLNDTQLVFVISDEKIESNKNAIPLKRHMCKIKWILLKLEILL